MAGLEFVGGAILLLAVIGAAVWLSFKNLGYQRNMARRSRERAEALRARADQYRAAQQYGPPPGYGQPPNPEDEPPRLLSGPAGRGRGALAW